MGKRWKAFKKAVVNLFTRRKRRDKPAKAEISSECVPAAEQGTCGEVLEAVAGGSQAPGEESPVDHSQQAPDDESASVSGVPPFPIESCSDIDAAVREITFTYEFGEVLSIGEGVSIIERSWKEDGTKEAMKVAKKTRLIRIEGHAEPVPLEVGLLILANKGPSIPQVIKLLDWHQSNDEYTLIMERPSPCKSLRRFLEQGVLSEHSASVIFRQAVFAANTCCLWGVFHGDINLDNLLINTNNLDVKLVGFRHGALKDGAPFTSFTGMFPPPEFEANGAFEAEPATAWSLGIVLFAMLLGTTPNPKDLENLNSKVWHRNNISGECCKLLYGLLQKNPANRIGLMQICVHKWFKALDYEQPNPKIIKINSSRYMLTVKLSEGGGRSVFRAVRLEDCLKVAVKFAPKKGVKYITVEGQARPLPMEIGLQILANRGPSVPQILQLLDWEDEKEDEYVMVLECPPYSEDLAEFVRSYHGGSVSEEIAAVVLKQVALAASTCRQRKVFHRDIKLEKILIDPYTLEVKLIDFGCGEGFHGSGNTEDCDSRLLARPEFHLTGKCYVEETMVWSLGFVLFKMCGDFPGEANLDLLDSGNWTHDKMSEECCNLLSSLLQKDLKKRIALDDICHHDWIQKFSS